MIGIVLCSHGRLAQELAGVDEMILGQQQRLEAVGVAPDDGEAAINARLSEAIQEVDDGSGVLLLTDMFGGTPMNLGCRYLDDCRVEVVTGANLAALIKALTGRRDDLSLSELARLAAEYGRKDISVAGELLRGSETTEES